MTYSEYYADDELNVDHDEPEGMVEQGTIKTQSQEQESYGSSGCSGQENIPSSRDSRGFSTIWSDTFEDGSFAKWDSTPAGSEIRILGSGSTNWGGQVTQGSSLASQKFVEGRDSNGQTNYLQKTFDYLDDYSKIKFSFYWAEQDLEVDEICKIEIYDKTNGYQTLKTIGTDNDNNDGIEMSDWVPENFDLYELSSYGLNEITDWSEIRIRFEWRAEMDTNGVPVADEWFLDDVELVGDSHPELLSGAVSPPVGDIRDDFNFSVNYNDADNDAPFFVRLTLNGVNHSMDELDFSDTEYSDGKIFVYRIALVADTTYSYQFWTSDGLTIVNTNIASGPVVKYGPPAAITVQAEKSILTADESLQFQATAHDAHDTLLSWVPEWSVSGGGVISEFGHFEATTVGTWRVFANYSEDNYAASGYMDITVEHGELDSLAIISDIENVSDIVTSDDVIKFEIMGYDSDTNPVPVEGYDINWSASGGGTLYPNGTFDANDRGFWKIIANTTSGSDVITAEFSFQVLPGLSTRIEINVSEKIISTGETALFTVRVYDSDGNYFSPSVIEWSVSGGGDITDLGKFSARSIGNFNVTASYVNENNETISGSEEFTVEMGTVKGIELSPSKVVMSLGETQTFTAEAYDEFGNYQPVSPSWDLQGGGEFNSSSAAFTARTAGEWLIEGAYKGVTAQVTVFINSGPPAYITVLPEDPLIIINDELDFEAKGFDSAGNELFIEDAWTVSGGGIIDTLTGLFKATETGVWTVYANFSGITGSTSIFVNQYTLVTIEVTPPMVTLKVDEVQQFSAAGLSATGVELNIKPGWSVFGTKEGASIDENGTFISAVSGTFKVYATQGGITGIAEVTIESSEEDASDKSDSDTDSKSSEMKLILIAIILVVVIILATVLSMYRIKRKLGGDPLLQDQDDDEPSYEDEYEMMYGGGAGFGSEPGMEPRTGVPGLDEGMGLARLEARTKKPVRKVKEVQVKRRARAARLKSGAVMQPGAHQSSPTRPAGPIRYDYKSTHAQSLSASLPVKDIPVIRSTKKRKKEDRGKKKEVGTKPRSTGKKRAPEKPEIKWDED